MVVVLLPIMIGFAALTVDMGHVYLVRSQLQNASDAAALAAAQTLNGTAAQIDAARLVAQRFASLHQANGSPVQLALNTANDPNGDIVLGNWDFKARVFTPAVATMPATKVNAAKVYTRRTDQVGGAVTMWLAQVVGIKQANVAAPAIAAGGGPSKSCGFPLAVPDCSIVDGSGNLRCNASMTFGQATTDNVGFTLGWPTGPVNTPGIDCEIANVFGGKCTPSGLCKCNSCNDTAISNGSIYISNGNNLSQTSIDVINNAVAAAGSAGVFVTVPVLGSGFSPSNCGSFTFNKAQPVVGYVAMHVTGASKGPPKTITATIDCTRTTSEPPGGEFFGFKSQKAYLVQ